MAAKSSAELEAEKRQWAKERKALLPTFLPQLVGSFLFSAAVLYGGFYWCDCIPVPELSDFGDKMTYYIRCCVFPCGVILTFAVMAVANKRGTSCAANPLAGNEDLVLTEKNILTNTVEQTLLFLLITLTLTTYLDPAEMKIIPLYSLLWIIGRVLFNIGYRIHPKYRSLGMLISLVTTAFFIAVTGYLMCTRGFMYGIVSIAGAEMPPKAEL